jgi:malonate-semialdehyde dehydrogenase (acetylating) / methylmalonate-semialdehyde dehydrogenase
MNKVQHFVDGQSWSGTSSRTSDIYNPATGMVTGHAVLATKDDVAHAVSVAKKAQASWGSQQAGARSHRQSAPP